MVDDEWSLLIGEWRLDSADLLLYESTKTIITVVCTGGVDRRLDINEHCGRRLRDA